MRRAWFDPTKGSPDHTDRRATRGNIEHMSNGNTITTTLAVIGGARLALSTASMAHRAYLNRRIGIEYDTWRDAFQNRRTTQVIRDARSLAMLCLRHGLTGSAAFYRWLADTLEKLNNRTPEPDFNRAERADLDEAMRRFQDLQERVNRDRL